MAAAAMMMTSCKKDVVPCEPDNSETKAPSRKYYAVAVGMMKMVMNIVVEPSAEAVSWRSYIALEDLTDRSREVMIKNINMEPTQDNLTRHFVVAYWGVNTIMGVAKDSDDVYGPMMLEVVNLNKEEASQASELILDM